MAKNGKKNNRSSWTRNVIDTLSSINRRDAVTFSIFLCIATAFWFAATAYQKSDTTVTIRLSVEGQPTSAVFTTHVPPELKVTLYDTNIKLFKYSYKSDIRNLTVDFSRYADVAGNFRISGAELQSLLQNNLESSTQITAISPALIDARYAMTGGKKVPVKITGVYTAASNYRDYQPIIVPDSITVHAPSYILDTLSYVYTKPLKHYGLKEDLNVKQPIELAVGVKGTPDSVSITIPVVQYVEKRVPQVPIKSINLPSGKGLSLFPRYADVRMLVNFDYYNQIAPSDFSLTVDYDDIKSEDQQFLPVYAKCRLDSTVVYGVQIDPKQVEYSIDEKLPWIE